MLQSSLLLLSTILLTSYSNEAHEFDIFGVALTTSYVVTVGGDSNVKLWQTGTQEHSLVHQFAGAHPLGAHHVAVNRNDGSRAATAGFGGEIILWDLENLEKLHQIKGQKGTSLSGGPVQPERRLTIVAHRN